MGPTPTQSEVRPAEVHLAQVRAAEVRRAEVCIEKARPVEVRLAEVRLPEVRNNFGILAPPSVPGGHALLEQCDMLVVRHGSTPESWERKGYGSDVLDTKLISTPRQ